MTRILGVLAGLLPFSFGCATGSKGGGAGPEAEWKAAEQVARDYVKAKDGKGPAKLRRGSARYSFSLQRADGKWSNVLVHKRQVVEARGIEPFGEYLKDEEFLKNRDLGPTELLSLLELYEAFPPVPKPLDYLYAEGPLAPRLEWGSDGGATFTIHYPPSDKPGYDNQPIAAPSGGPSGGPLAPRPNTRARLAIPPSYALAWKLDDAPAP